MVMKKMISMLICFLLVGCQVSNPEKGSKKAFQFINEKGKRSGKIKKGREPKLAYYIDERGKRKCG